MKQRQLKVQKLKEILTLYTNNLDPNNQEHREFIFNIEDRLLKFGLEKANQACERYLWVARSNFFDHSLLMQCLLEVSNNLPDSNDAWIEVVKQIRSVGMNGKPNINNHLTVKTINSLGGWRFLCESANQGYDRNAFIKIYDELKNKEMLNNVLD